MGGIVLSSRIRLARNLNKYPFPIKMNKEQSEKLVNEIRNIIELNINNNTNNITKNLFFVDMNDIDPISKQALVEKHLISPEFAETERKTGLILSRDKKVSIMINEEDHLRIQAFVNEFNLKDAMRLCIELDDFFSENIDLAYSKKFGYLTSCITNVGTGLRASAMLHLPALVMTGYIGAVLEACNKLGVAVRGLYGENSNAMGNMFQISNQLSLGVTEEDIIMNVSNVIEQISNKEKEIREELYNKNPKSFEDKIYRSYGIIKYARVISSEESLRLLSDVRLGIDMGIIKDVTREKLDEIIVLIQPANLQKYLEEPLDFEERDVKRAEVIRQKLN